MPTVDDLIRRIAKHKGGRRDSISELLTKTGWTAGVRPLLAPVAGADLLELSCAEEPQALVVIADDLAPAVVASLGYSREAPYAIWWGSEQLTLQDTRYWQDAPGDRPLLAADSEDRWAVRELLDVLTPIDVLEDLPGQYGVPSKRRRPLHETLSRALTTLRIQVANAGLMHGEDPDTRDSAVLRLFHQLLFIRFQEDRDAAASTVELHKLQPHDDVHNAVKQVLNDYREQLNSSLFEPAGIATDELPSAALRDVIREMVEPWAELRLNFSVSRSEIAGRLYQSYLRSLPTRREQEPQSALFERALTVDKREKTASYYTPPGLARLVVDSVLGLWLDNQRPECPGQVRILDPACGSGAFLIAAYRRLLHYFAELYGRDLTSQEREEILLTCIYGADVDERALGLAQVQLLEEAHVRGRLPVLGDNLIPGDSLPSPPDGPLQDGAVNWSAIVAATTGFDVVVANPPFGASIKLPGRVEVATLRQVRRLYPEVYSGHADYAYVFAALSLRLLRDNGAVGFVLPRTALDSTSGLRLRRLLSDAGVTSVVDFRGGKLFDIDAYVCTVATGAGRSVEVASVIDSRTDGRLLIQDATINTGGSLRRRKVPSSVFRHHADEGWSEFRLRWDLSLREEIGVAVGPLVPPDDGKRVARFGTKPAALAHFVVESGDWTEDAPGEVTIAGRRFPARFFPRLVRGSDINPFHLIETGERVLVPFETDGAYVGTGSIADEVERRGGLPTNVQHGDLQTLRAPKLLIRTFSREPGTVADVVGDRMPLMGVSGAIAVRLDDVPAPDLHAYEALLNGAFYQWLLQGLGRPKHGGWIELTIPDVATLPVPALESQDSQRLIECRNDIYAAIGEEDLMLRRGLYHEGFAKLDELVFELIGASHKLRTVVDSELVRVT
jgi:hypothetical protein